MQPILFLQSGDTGTIKRISGAEDTRRFLACGSDSYFSV